MPSKRTLFIFIAILLLLSACDPIPQPYETVLQVAADGSSAYAYVQQRHTWGIGGHPPDADLYYASDDGGVTWQEISSAPPVLEQKVEAARSQMSDNCDPSTSQDCTQVNGLGEMKVSYDGGATWEVSNSYWYPTSTEETELYDQSINRKPACMDQECFRITSQHIERSIDGGTSWMLDWQLPPGRDEYLKRYYSAKRDGITEDIYPVDLTLVGTTSGTAAIAAMGNQGILVRSPEGAWQAVSVGEARPIPLAAANLNDAFRLFLDEYFRGLLIAGLVSGILAAAAWVFLKVRLPNERSVIKPWPLIYAVICIAVSIILLLPTSIKVTGNVIGGIPVICLPALLAGAAAAWGAVYGGNPKRRWLVPSLLIGLIYPLLVFLALLLPYLFWSWGWIPSLGWAAGIGIALGMMVGVWALIHTWMLASRAGNSP